jgi:hypothetical protein
LLCFLSTGITFATVMTIRNTTQYIANDNHMASRTRISNLLTQGDIALIAQKLGLSPAATSAALRRERPGHPAVQEALRMAKENGGIDTAQTLAALGAA